MITIKAIIENQFGVVIGAELSDGSKVILLPDEQVRRAELAGAARTLAARYGVTLPENPAIPPADAGVDEQPD
jgi:hypothetical protein